MKSATFLFLLSAVFLFQGFLVHGCNIMKVKSISSRNHSLDGGDGDGRILIQSLTAYTFDFETVPEGVGGLEPCIFISGMGENEFTLRKIASNQLFKHRQRDNSTNVYTVAEPRKKGKSHKFPCIGDYDLFVLQNPEEKTYQRQTFTFSNEECRGVRVTPKPKQKKRSAEAAGITGGSTSPIQRRRDNAGPSSTPSASQAESQTQGNISDSPHIGSEASSPGIGEASGVGFFSSSSGGRERSPSFDPLPRGHSLDPETEFKVRLFLVCEERRGMAAIPREDSPQEHRDLEYYDELIEENTHQLLLYSHREDDYKRKKYNETIDEGVLESICDLFDDDEDEETREALRDRRFKYRIWKHYDRGPLLRPKDRKEHHVVYHDRKIIWGNDENQIPGDLGIVPYSSELQRDGGSGSGVRTGSDSNSTYNYDPSDTSPSDTSGSASPGVSGSSSDSDFNMFLSDARNHAYDVFPKLSPVEKFKYKVCDPLFLTRQKRILQLAHLRTKDSKLSDAYVGLGESKDLKKNGPQIFSHGHSLRDSKHQSSLLILAAKLHDSYSVRVLLSMGFDPTVQDADGDTFLHAALRENFDDVVREAYQDGCAAKLESVENKRKESCAALASRGGNRFWYLYRGERSLEGSADRELMQEAVNRDGISDRWAVQDASEESKKERGILLEAMKTDRDALWYASEELKKDREFMLEAVKRDGNTLEYASKELRNDRDIVLIAVKRGRSALQYASNELRNDRDIVLEAVKRDGAALKFASEELKNDRRILLEAMNTDRDALWYASEELKKDREFMLEAGKCDGNAFQYASKQLRKDREFVLEAVKRNGSALEFASEELRKDRVIVFEAAKSLKLC